MASVLFQNAVKLMLEGDLDLEVATLKGRLLMTNTTADTNPDADSCADLTLDECDATGYAQQTLTTPAVTADDTDNEAVFASDNAVFSGLGGDATRDYQGMLVVKNVDGGNGDIPIFFIDFTADVTKFATQVTVPCPAEGWLNIGQPA